MVRETMARLMHAAIHALQKFKLLAPTTGALVGAIVSGIPGAIAGAALAAAITKSFADDWAAVRNLQFRMNKQSAARANPNG
jgi:hypothetical protein